MERFEKNNSVSKTKKRLLIISGFLGGVLVLTTCSPTPAESAGVDPPVCTMFNQSHAKWNELLTKTVNAGSVNYAAIKQNHQNTLMAYLKQLESVCKEDFEKFTRNEKLAFYINAYNAYTVKLIVDNYPLKSIRKIGITPGSAWTKDVVNLPYLFGKNVSLHYLENEIIRKQFQEPLIHFALVCAAKGCPPLLNRAFVAQGLNNQMEKQAVAFINDSSKNRFDSSSNTLYLSKIFNWYDDDFGGKSALPAYVAQYLGEDHKATLVKKMSDVKIKFMDYDWSLNSSK